jgi:hypothetical protein
MPSPQLGGIGAGASFEELLNYVIRLERKLDFVLQTLDSDNIFEAGGWRVTPDQLASKDLDVGMSTADTGGDDTRFWAGDAIDGTPKFKVTKSGIMTATDGVFSGDITADSGTIGGWVISADALKDSSGTVGMSSAVTGGDDIRFFAGSATPSSAPFRVTEAGIATLISAVIRSVLSGEGIVIDSTGLHSYDSSGVERISISTLTGYGTNAIVTRDSSGVEQGVYTYGTETVDGASRTGQYITAHGCYLLFDDSGDIRIQDSISKGFRTSAAGYPEMNDGSGWSTIGKASDITTAQNTANAAQTSANARGFSLSYDGANLSLLDFNGNTLSTVAIP